ncbi:hypothetical protein M0804_011378 [Polistes exclamans]|nr:hypothetical protein M0804_011378 [Polistes exclamans]
MTYQIVQSPNSVFYEPMGMQILENVTNSKTVLNANPYSSRQEADTGHVKLDAIRLLCVMVKQSCCKWIWIPLIILSILTIIESKRRQKRAFSVSSHNYQQQNIISKENHQDLTSNSNWTLNKKSLNVNAFEETIMMTATTTSLFDVNKIVKRKTLLDLEKPMLLDDINKHFDLNELSNDTHIRVKRTDSEFDNHPKSLIHLRNNYLEDLTNSFSGKSSNNFNEYYNISNHRDVSSNSNETFVNNHITETNHYFNNPINDSILSKICCNDDENKVVKDDLIISNLAEVNKTRFKRENKSKKNARRRVAGHGKKRKMKKQHLGGKGKKKGISFKAANKRHPNSLKPMSHFKSKRTNHMIRNNSPKIIDNYKIESKMEMEDSSNDKSNIDDDISRKKDTSDNKRSSRERNDNEQTEVTSIKENKDAIVNDSVRDKRSLHKKDDIVFTKSEGTISSWTSKNGRFRSKRNGSKDLIIPNYSNVLKTSSNQNQISNEKPRADRAVKSIEDIKELAEKLVSKVNELQNYLSYENERYKNEEENNKKKKLESREIEVPRDNKTIEEEVVLETPKLVDECVRISDLSSALKTLNDNKNASIDDKITIREESETEKINLLKDRITNPLTKRIVRKNRIKRKSRRKWGRWTGWSSCSVTCGKGRQIRWRHCLRDCSTVETEMEEKACQMTACPPGKFLGIF